MVLTALFGMAALAATGFALWQMREDHMAAAMGQIAHIARGVAAQTAREIADADSDLLRIIGAARIQPERLLAADQRDIVMRRNVASIAQASALAFVDTAGRVHVYVRPGDAAPPPFPPVRPRDGVIVRDGADRLQTGLYLQRTLGLEEKPAVGVVLLRFSEEYLSANLRTWRGATPAALALTTTQGRVLLQHPGNESQRGKSLAALTAAHFTPTNTAARVRYSDPVDGRSYLLASQPLPGLPLTVHVWIAERDVLQQWLSQSALLAGTTLALVLIALFLARRHAGELGRRASSIGRMQALQNALALEQAKLETIVRTVPSAVFRARLDKRRTVALSFMSGQIRSLWGVSAEDAVRHPRRALRKVPRAHRKQLLGELSEAVREGSGWDVTVPIQHSQGMRWLRIHAAPVDERGADGESGTPNGSPATVWDGIISDVTEQKLAERQVVLLNLDLERRVEERTRELADLNRELEAFADSVSHDLRAPLRGIRGYAEIIREAEGLPGDTAALLERISAQGEHMEQLIQALLELSRLSRYEVRRIDVDLTEIASETLRELAARDPQRNVTWTVQPGLQASADPRLVRVLFENLLGNAWKFTRERDGATIEVGSLPARAGAVTYFVKDNGAGFDPAYADRLFRPFQRLHPASRFEGTGIGLATVQRIVRRHGGRIRAESQPGEGATFLFELPAGT